MSAGLIVIASGKQRVFINHNKNGLLYENWDVKKIAFDLKKLIYDKNLFFTFQKNARNYALKNFSIEKHSARTFNFFKSFK